MLRLFYEHSQSIHVCTNFTCDSWAGQLTELGHIEAGFEPSSYQIYSSKVLITLRRHVTQLCSLDSLASEIKTTLPYGWHSFGDTCLLQQSLF